MQGLPVAEILRLWNGLNVLHESSAWIMQCSHGRELQKSMLYSSTDGVCHRSRASKYALSFASSSALEGLYIFGVGSLSVSHHFRAPGGQYGTLSSCPYAGMDPGSVFNYHGNESSASASDEEQERLRLLRQQLNVVQRIRREHERKDGTIAALRAQVSSRRGCIAAR